MVFLIQNTQNRDTAAMHIKLDELIRVTRNAHNALLDLEELDENHLAKIRCDYENLAKKARESLEKDGGDIVDAYDLGNAEEGDAGNRSSADRLE
jgi:low affinity Fe/Cu permease